MNSLSETTKQYLNSEASLIIDGKRCAATSKESISIINACNGENIYSLRDASGSDVDAEVPTYIAEKSAQWFVGWERLRGYLDPPRPNPAIEALLPYFVPLLPVVMENNAARHPSGLGVLCGVASGITQ